VTRSIDIAAQRLAKLGLTLPEPPAGLNAFQPYVRHGDTVYTSGQIATVGGRLVATGCLGGEVDLLTGQEAARVCALNVLAQLRAAAGNLDDIARLVKVTVYVASTPGFTQQPEVADSASRLFAAVLGTAGAHARSAIGVAALPAGTPVEIEAIAILRSDPARSGTSRE
jgi:enamine deaminase RidA (YjgF/YER057c/UK114 family)